MPGRHHSPEEHTTQTTVITESELEAFTKDQLSACAEIMTRIKAKIKGITKHRGVSEYTKRELVSQIIGLASWEEEQYFNYNLYRQMAEEQNSQTLNYLMVMKSQSQEIKKLKSELERLQ